jgi:hypothetical protein
MEYIIQNNIGKVKYLLSYCDGVKQHKDGSPFWDIVCFKSKKKLYNFISELIKK